MTAPRLEAELDPPRLADKWSLSSVPPRLTCGELAVYLDAILTPRDFHSAILEAVAALEHEPALLAALVYGLALVYPAGAFPPGTLTADRVAVLASVATTRKRQTRRRRSEKYVRGPTAHLALPVPEVHEAGSSLTGTNNVFPKRSPRRLTWT